MGDVQAGSVFILSCRAALSGPRWDQCLCEREIPANWSGRALLEKAVAHSPRLQIHALVAAFRHNEPSLRLFEKLGFERWGFLPRIARWDEVERDLLIVGRHISAET